MIQMYGTAKVNQKPIYVLRKSVCKYSVLIDETTIAVVGQKMFKSQARHLPLSPAAVVPPITLFIFKF